jgi:hypothetical protein
MPGWDAICPDWNLKIIKRITGRRSELRDGACLVFVRRDLCAPQFVPAPPALETLIREQRDKHPLQIAHATPANVGRSASGQTEAPEKRCKGKRNAYTFDLVSVPHFMQLATRRSEPSSVTGLETRTGWKHCIPQRRHLPSASHWWFRGQ